VTEDTLIRVEPKQERGKARVEAIRAAARQHYVEVGGDALAFNFDAVAALAGCSVATIYRYFKDSKAILDDLFPDRSHADVKLAAIRTIAAMSGTPTEKWMSVEHILAQ
jgi:AcrR family transcriptional regulator